MSQSAPASSRFSISKASPPIGFASAARPSHASPRTSPTPSSSTSASPISTASRSTNRSPPAGPTSPSSSPPATATRTCSRTRRTARKSATCRSRTTPTISSPRSTSYCPFTFSKNATTFGDHAFASSCNARLSRSADCMSAAALARRGSPSRESIACV
jgi:hypothetical protein